jgi:hypothetical protein
LDVPGLERPFQLIAIGEYDYEIATNGEKSELFEYG